MDIVTVVVGIATCCIVAAGIAYGVDRLLLWREKRRNKRKTLAQVQAERAAAEWDLEAILARVDAYLREVREEEKSE